MGITECDHHQSVARCYSIALDSMDNRRPVSLEFSLVRSFIDKKCILCGATFSDGEWVGGSIDLKIDTDRINLKLLKTRFNLDNIK